MARVTAPDNGNVTDTSASINITEPGVHRMYDRRSEELRARHILFMVKPDAAPEETLKAYTKAN